jgi:signal peptidase
LVFTAIAVVAIFLVLSVFPIKGGYKTFIVLSGSMEPKIHTGSIVIVKPENNYQVGDVITFNENNKLNTPVTHRIAGIKEDKGESFYTTKGDANDSPDLQEVKGGEIIGKVLFSVPLVGYAVNTVKKPFGFMLVIIIPVVIIVYEEFRKIIAEIKRMVRERKNKKEEGTEEKKSDENKDDVKIDNNIK